MTLKNSKLTKSSISFHRQLQLEVLKSLFSQMACSDQDSAVTQVAVGGLVHDFHVE
jgi:hypothetical protein